MTPVHLIIPMVLSSVVISALGEHVPTEERVARLEAQVDMLTNEMLRMKNKMDDLQCVQIDSEKSATPEGDPDVNEQVPFLIREIRREETPTGYRMSVEFQKRQRSDEITSFWSSHTSATGKVFLTNTQLSSSSNTEHTLGETYVYLQKPEPGLEVFISDENSYSIGLELTSNLNGSELENEIQVPHVNFQAQTEIVYERGQNASLTFTVENDIERGSYSSGMLINPKTRAITFADANFFNETTEKNYLESKEEKLYMNTAETPFGGLIRLYFKREGKGDLVKSAWLTRTFVLRPSDQTGPYPQGFLKMRTIKDIHSSYGYNNPFGSEEYDQKCEKNDTCYVICNAYGENIEHFQIERVSQNEDMQLVSVDDIVSETKTDYIWVKTFQVSYPINEDRDQIYECKIRNSEGITAVSNVTIRWIDPIKIQVNILSNESFVRVVENNLLELTCVATGDPLPQLSFSLVKNLDSFEIGADGIDGEPDSIEVTEKRIVATKRVAKDLIFASCFALQESLDFQMDQEYYNLPE